MSDLVKKLSPLGFSADQCLTALKKSENNLENATISGGYKFNSVNSSSEVETKKHVSPLPAVSQQSPSEHPFILVSSSGTSASQHSHMFGLYKKRANSGVYVYDQEDTDGFSRCKLWKHRGVWSITYNDYKRLRATTQVAVLRL